MIENLYQKKILNRKWFQITPEGLSIKSKKLTESNEVFVKFEDIGVKVIKSKIGKRGWFVAAVIFLLLTIGLFFDEKTGGNTDKNAFVVYFIFSIICFLVFALSFKRSFYLTNNDNKNAIEFFIDKPSKKELHDFINSLKSERKAYLLNMYGQITKLLSYEQQYNQLQWLNNIDAIQKEEYEIKIAELNSLFKTVNTVTGFQLKKN